MMLSKIAGLRNVSLGLAVFLAVCIRACPAEPAKQKTVMGELKLKGQYIERLVLRPRVGLAEVINDPNQAVRLPVGENRPVSFALLFVSFLSLGQGSQLVVPTRL